MGVRVWLIVCWTQLLMIAERWLAPLLWLGVGIALLVAFSWLGVWQALPAWVHAAALVGVVAATGWQVFTHREGVWFPGLRQAAYRAAQRSGVANDPVTTLLDEPAIRTSQGILLWEMNRARARDALRNLRAKGGDFPLQALDPYRVRYLAGLLLLAGLIHAGSRADVLALQAFRPGWAALWGGGQPPVVSAWLEPPEYAGQQPVYLPKETSQPVPVLAGSRLHVDASGAGAMLRVRANGRSHAFQDQPGGVQQAVVTLTGGESITVKHWGRTLVQWPVVVASDQPPAAELKAPAESSGRGTLRLPYLAQDDLGIGQLQLRVIRQKTPLGYDGNALKMTPEPIFLPVPAAQGVRKAEGSAMLDLALLPWPGEMVSVALIARDTAGQVVVSAEQAVQLPQLEFRDPFATAVAGLREKLDASLLSRLPVSFGLKDLTMRPGLYQGDAKLFMALRVATFRLHRDFRPDAHENLRRLLWDMAVYAEYGNSLMQQRSLDQAMDALLQALEEGRGVDELNQLMGQLQRQVMELMRGIPPIDMPQDQAAMLSEQMETTDMREILAKAVALYRSGAKEEARELLKQLQEALRQAAQDVSPEQLQKMTQAAEANRELQALIKAQEALLNETYTQSGDLDSYGTPHPDKAIRQQALKQQLDGVMEKVKALGAEAPENLPKAGGHMDKAVEALRHGRLRRATSAQGDALQALKEGASQMQQQLRQQLGMQMLTFGSGGRPVPSGGMGQGGQFNYGDVKIPDEGQLQKSRQILDELFRRSNRKNIPEVEQRFLDRLLEPFK